jgi:hypothetical protein
LKQSAFLSHNLEFRLWGRQFSGRNGIGESTGLVGAIAEGLVCGVPAATETDDRPAGQAEGFAIRIEDFEVAFNPNGSVVIDSKFRGRHFFS